MKNFQKILIVLLLVISFNSYSQTTEQTDTLEKSSIISNSRADYWNFNSSTVFTDYYAGIGAGVDGRLMEKDLHIFKKNSDLNKLTPTIRIEGYYPEHPKKVGFYVWDIQNYSDRLYLNYGFSQDGIKLETSTLFTFSNKGSFTATSFKNTDNSFLVSSEGNITANKYYGDGSQLTGITSAWTENGENAYRTSGNVGIGTDDPQGELHIYSSETNPKIRIVKEDFSGNISKDTGNDDPPISSISKWDIENRGSLVFNPNYGDYLISFSSNGNITTSGKIYANNGIYTSTNSLLGLYSGSSYNNGAYIRIYNETSTGFKNNINMVVNDGGEFSFKKYYNDGTDNWDDLVTINYDGNVGIGTTTPSAALQIVGSNKTGLRVNLTDMPNNGYGFSLTVDGNTPSLVKAFSVNDKFYVMGDGKLIINDNFNVASNGNVTTSGNITTSGKIYANKIYNNDNCLSLNGGSGWAQASWVEICSATSTAKNNINMILNDEGNFNISKYYNDSTDHWKKLVTINYDGNVGIGTTAPSAALQIVSDEAKLMYLKNASNEDAFLVKSNGYVYCKELIVQTSSWFDNVFEDDYQLMPISDLEKFVKDEHHLPEIPSEQEVIENGVKSGEMDALLLKKVEELSLYIIELNKEVEQLKIQNAELSSKLNNN